MYTACAASSCAGPWHAVGAVGFAYREWGYVIDAAGETYDGTPAHARNVPDPRPTASATTDQGDAACTLQAGMQETGIACTLTCLGLLESGCHMRIATAATSASVTCLKK